MHLRRLVLQNILGGGARSVVIALGAALVAGFTILSTLVVSGAEATLQQSLQRLGADIIVFPWGTRTEELEGGHLFQTTSSGWIPRSYVQRIGTVKGVEAVSPQLYLATLRGTPYCSATEMFVIAFDPHTDFALESWIDERLYRDLAVGEAIGGSHIIDPGSAGIDIDGFPLRMVGQLAPTGTDLDETLFVSLDTAVEMARHARGRSDAVVRISPQSVTTALVRLKPGNKARDAAVGIMERVPGVIPIESAKMLQVQRGQIVGLLTTVLGLMILIWCLSAVFIGLVFTMTVHARRRQIGVMRALGATSSLVFRSLLVEGVILGLCGGAVGIAVSTLAATLFGEAIAVRWGLPFGTPAAGVLAAIAFGGLALALASVGLGALFPAMHISRQEPAHTMRE